MKAENVTATQKKNVDLCLYCAHFQALGCGGSTRFCTKLNAFLRHDPHEKECEHRQTIEGAD